MSKTIMGRESVGGVASLKKAGENLLAGKLSTLVDDYVVYKSGPTTDLDISGDGGSPLNASPWILKLDGRRVMIAWRYYTGVTYYLRIVVVSNILSDTQIEGTYIDVASNSSNYYSECAMALTSANKVLVCYKILAGTSATSKLYEITNDDTITLLDTTTFGTGETPTDISVINVDTDKALTTYATSANTKKVFISTTIGSDIVNYSSVTFGGTGAYSHPNMQFLETNKIFFAYRNEGNSNYGTALIFTVSGTTASQGTAVVFESAATSYISSAILELNKLILVYTDVGNSSYGTACTVNISGTVITPNTPQEIETGGIVSRISTARTSDSKVFITFLIGTNLYKNFLNISGSTITPETKQLVATSINESRMTQTSESRAVMTYNISVDVFMKIFDCVTGDTPIDIGFQGYTVSASDNDSDEILKVAYFELKN